MPDSLIKISLIVATYAPGNAINRLIDSLDRQTLPAAEFEVIFIDDGSPDDTLARLHTIASTRPNVTVLAIDNSGWPSRPRNIGLRQARGEYVMYVDHDDSIYPDGLARAWAYAAETGADILSPKESKTNDVWWGTSSLTAGNIPDVLREERVHRLLPMVPHKLYRRTLLLERGIDFPEGARVLWEDWYVNVEAYRHANRVAVLADTPVYLWHGSDMNSSHTFDPARADFWDRLEQLLEFIESTLDEGPYRQDRRVLMEHNVRTRVIDRCARLLMNDALDDPEAKERALARSNQLLERFCTDEVFAALPKKHQGLAILLRARRPDLVAGFHRADIALTASTRVTGVSQSDGILRLDTQTRWHAKDAAKPGFALDSGRLLRVVAPEVRAALPPELLDHSEDLGRMRVDVAARARKEFVTWQLPHHAEPARFDAETAALVASGHALLDIDTARLDRPLQDTVWDLRTRTEWCGMERKGALGYAGPARPWLAAGRPAVAYANTTGGMSLDLAGTLRTFATDAKPHGAAGAVAAFSVPLVNATASGPADVPAELAAIPADVDAAAGVEEIETLAKIGDLRARVVADGQDVRLVGGTDLVPGQYVLYARRNGKFARTRARLLVADDGLATFH
ncbi:glycosyltransferase [Asanoa sp. NPDC050611]|uniref:glycosyltransferase family 2 protein n=1 Tax=Asanoa sp. NPDC050611 TaxID=3157098 RepID=UPI0033E5BE82